jgi:hypothetical protein
MKLLIENFKKFLEEGHGPFTTPHQLFIPAGCRDGECSVDELENIPPIENGEGTLEGHGPSKPMGGLWTSTAWELPSRWNLPYGAWSSDWNEWLWSNMPKWMSSHGVLFKPTTSNVFHIAGNEDLEKLREDFPKTDESGIDWVKAFEVYDGIHYGKPNGAVGTKDPGMWDVESTCWRSFDVLKDSVVRVVPVEQPEDESDF